MQTPSPQEFTAPAPRGAISRADATKKAAAILQKCGITPKPPVKVRYLDFPHSAYCEVFWQDYMVSLFISFQSQSAGLTGIHRQQRPKEREKDIRTSAPFKITTKAQAEAYIMRYARGVGFPPNTKTTMARLELTRSNGKAEGLITELPPGGYGYHGNRRPPGMDVIVDMRDGALVSLRQRWDGQFEGTERKITPEAALKIAIASYRKQKHIPPAQPVVPTPGTPTLYYVPSEGSQYDPTGGSSRFSLAYVVAFGPTEIYVDAGNGRVINEDRPPGIGRGIGIR